MRAARHIVRGALQRRGASQRQGAERRAHPNGSSTDVNPELKKNPKMDLNFQPDVKRDTVSGSGEGIERWRWEMRGIEIGGESAGLATDSRCGKGWEGWEEGGDGARTGGMEGWGMLSEDDVEQSLRETGRCAWQAGGLGAMGMGCDSQPKLAGLYWFKEDPPGDVTVVLALDQPFDSHRDGGS